jgi:pullulanase
VPTVVVGHLQGALQGDRQGQGNAGADFAEVLYAINVDKVAHSLVLPALQGRAFVLHPVHTAPGAADPRPAALASWDSARGGLTVPARTALVYVMPSGR